MKIYSELSESIENGEVGRVTRWAQKVLGEVAFGHHLVRGVRHPLGFLCLPIYRLDDEGVCIHMWGQRWGRMSLTTSPMHCHSWELLSCVLSSQLCNETVRLVDNAESPTHQVFDVRSDASGDEIVATGKLVRAEVLTSAAHHAGETYRLPAGIFHQTLVPDTRELVVTVALGKTRVGELDRSLGGVHTASHQVRRELCDPRELVEAAEAARLVIAGQGAVSPLTGQ